MKDTGEKWELLPDAGPYRALKKPVDPVMIETIKETAGTTGAVRVKLGDRSAGAVLSQVRKILKVCGCKVRSKVVDKATLLVWVD